MRESWNRLETFWLVEALGQVERDGYFEDNEVLGCLAQNATLLEANDEELVVRRAQELSVRHPRVIRLRTNIGHLVTSARHLLTVCIFVSLVAGMSAASAIFGAGNSINIVTAWIALVGVNLLSLVLTVSLVLAAPGKMQFSLPGAWLWLLGRVGRKYNAPLLLLAGDARRTNRQDWRVLDEFQPHFLDHYHRRRSLRLPLVLSFPAICIRLGNDHSPQGLLCRIHRLRRSAAMHGGPIQPVPVGSGCNRPCRLR